MAMGQFLTSIEFKNVINLILKWRIRNEYQTGNLDFISGIFIFILSSLKIGWYIIFN